MIMNRRDFIRGGIKGTAAYTLLATTLLGSHQAMARKKSGTSSDTPTTEEEKEHLAFMREEEKLARDVYLKMHDIWGMGVFYNIAQSEQIHTDAVKAKIEKYGLVDPVIDDTVGAFQNHDLAVLYDALIQQGSVSAIDALWVGGAIEEIDIIDLQDAIDTAEHDDIARVYQNLQMGSHSHLRAFVAKLEQNGVEYKAQYLPPETVDAILNTSTGISGGGRRGRG
jgi:hypothetical protein